MKLEELKCIKNSNIDEYLEFYKYVKSKMEYPEWLGNMEKEDINEILNNKGVLFCYYLNNTIVCSMMYIQPSNKTLLKHKIKYDEKIVGSCGPIMVNPKYIGNKLQQQMLIELEKYCTSINQKYIFTKVHPDNFYSINNFIKNGYKYIETYESSHNGFRNIYLKEIDIDS
ncbi:MAG: GNAT family N-acetyltransferase [Clostridiales bacterium]|nr:GNAT family N-acetyltransferase [Clostridiales bacterium]